MSKREFFDWCPHSTFNPMGCGVCKPHRERIEKLERVEAFVREMEALLDRDPISIESKIVHREWRIMLTLLKRAIAGES